MPYGERPRSDWCLIAVDALHRHAGQADLQTMYRWVEAGFVMTPQELRPHGTEKHKYRNDFRWALKALEKDGTVARIGRGVYKMV